MSVTKRLKVGGQQGSTKGVLSYMSQSNNNTDCLPEEDRFKYFDDATVLEVINLLFIGLSSYRVRERIPSTVSLVSLKCPFSRQDAPCPRSLELESMRTGGHPDHRSTLPVP